MADTETTLPAGTEDATPPAPALSDASLEKAAGGTDTPTSSGFGGFGGGSSGGGGASGSW